jgi:hypothetical protein
VGETERGAVTERVPSAVGASKPEPHPEPEIIRDIREHHGFLTAAKARGEVADIWAAQRAARDALREALGVPPAGGDAA